MRRSSYAPVTKLFYGMTELFPTFSVCYDFVSESSTRNGRKLVRGDFRLTRIIINTISVLCNSNFTTSLCI